MHLEMKNAAYLLRWHLLSCLDRDWPVFLRACCGYVVFELANLMTWLP